MTSYQMPPQVLHRLILDQALATVEYSPEEYEAFCQQMHQEGAYQTWLQQQGVTPEQFDAWAHRELKIRKFQQQRWGKKLNSYFLQRKYQLDQVVCSLIYLHNKEIAQELYFRIIEGEQSFAEVARAYSEAPEAEVGGTVGPIELGKLPPTLARLFHGGRLGQLWEPVAVEKWIVIARLEQVLPVQLDESMRQVLLNELLDDWLKNQLRQRFPA